MNYRSYVLALISSSTLLLANCGSRPYTSADATIAISPQISSLAINTSQTFTATVTGASPSLVSWGGGVIALGPTVTYTAPATPPIYPDGPGTNDTPWSDQGTVTIVANLPAPNWGEFISTLRFAIIGPTSVGMTPATTSVQLGKLVYLYPYCVGWANNGINWTVNGVANGNATLGTMTVSPDFAYYTAPATMPMTSNTVTVTAACQADATKTASTIITLTQ